MISISISINDIIISSIISDSSSSNRQTGRPGRSPDPETQKMCIHNIYIYIYSMYNMYVYIYIYIYVEREISVYTYIYIYI